MKRILFIVSLISNSICLSQNQKIDSLFVEFNKNSFYESVYPSKLALENYQQEIIPKLIELVNDKAFVKLTGTADLIYPGAEYFYGHGHYVPYAMDWISIRAGWLLEQLTFENFGYATINAGNLKWETKSVELDELRKLQSRKVKEWWAKNENNWNRLDALKTALSSDDINRISNAIQYLRFGETKCDGLSKEVLIKELKPLASKLKNSNDNDVQVLLNQLENEDLSYWLRKQNNIK